MSRSIKKSLTGTVCKALMLSSLLSSNIYQSHAVEVSSVNSTYSFSMQKESLMIALAKIEKVSDYVFIYKDNLLNEKVSIDIELRDQPIEVILKSIFKDTDISYKINNKQVILRRNKSNNNNQLQNKSQKKKRLEGVVLDENNIPAIGVNIVQKGNPTVGTITDMDGNFMIDIPLKSILIVSYIGYKSQEIQVGKNDFVKVSLVPDIAALEEVVVTAFGVSQKKESMVGSVQQIRPSDLTVPSSSLTSSFAGRMAGVIAVQKSGEPGADGSNFWIRGKSTFSGATGALIVLDGVEISGQELNALDAEVIESFSILKDATATALYGTRGANGVMIVTTKSGKDMIKPVINFRFEAAVRELTSVPEMVDGNEYMRLYNEPVTTRGGNQALFTEEKIKGTLAGNNSYIYPNVNWYDTMFKPLSDSERFNFNIRGGRKVVTYFMSASVKRDGGNLRSLSNDYFSYNNSVNVVRYDFINNLKIKATPTTDISLGLNVNMQDWSGPKKSVNDIFSISKEASPVDFPVKYPSEGGAHELWGGLSGGVYNGGFRNPVAEYVSGYKSSFTSIVNTNLKLKQDLKVITKGLTFNALISFKNTSKTTVERGGAYNQYEKDVYDTATGEYTLSRVGGEQNTALSTTGSSSGTRRLYIQTYLDYTRKFGIQSVNALLLYNQDQLDLNLPDNLLNSLPRRKQGLAGRFSYSYDNRYMTEVNFGYNGSENFEKGNRYGFFPSFALGYNISEEKFWEPLSDILPYFKLRGSFGLVGNDAISNTRFAYLEDIILSNNSWGYTTGVNQNITQNGPHWNRFYNPELTWEVGEKYNIGFDAQLFHDFKINVDLFQEIRKNIYVERGNTIPDFIGTSSTKVYGNVGKMKNVGMDISLDYNKQLTKDFFLSFKGTFTFARNTVLAKDEPPYALYPNLQQVGHSVDQKLLYLSNGLFVNADDVLKHAEQTLGYIPMPGDIKYSDIPNVEGIVDGIIDSNDRQYHGNPTTPEIIYGFGPSMRYKNWDFSLFFQGAAKVSILMNDVHPFGKNATRGVMDFIAEDYWTESNPNANAAYPRLTRDTNNNNVVQSTYWLRNGAFLKLKNAEVGFSHKMFRVYLSGTNLMTFSPFKYWDPEMGSGNGLGYPTQKTYNVGIQFTFK